LNDESDDFLMSMIRALTRYWFVIVLLFLVVALQLGLSLIIAGTVDDTSVDAAPASPSLRISTSLPTLTPTKLASPTPTFTASPTRTPSPTQTPTGTLTPSPTPSPSATPTVTSTPTPEPTPLVDDVTVRVPIMMYHYISIPPADADAVRRDLSVAPAQFESHLAYLRQAGFETISLQELTYALSRERSLPPKPIILSFDDGYRDNYENAFPLLRQYGYSGTFFVFTQPIDTYNVSYLTWEMIIEMHKAGMEFGSHSYRHPDLTGRDVDFLVYEILGSKEAIEERIGEPVRFFSYPAGRYDELTIRVLDSANFWGAVTTQFGIDQSFSNRFEMRRIRVRGNDTADDLADKLRLF
jgi:peptidoglycan/xylan/chitin deacetylase (PgdA/CDA1 family)